MWNLKNFLAIKKKKPQKKQEEQNRVNDKIQASQVRVIGSDGTQVGIYPTEEAIDMAFDEGLDLVEISPKADPPVCKIIEYSKFKYEQKKKNKEIKQKSQKTVVKEVRFGPNTDDHDFQFKLKHARSFINDGAKVKAYVHFVGRSIIYKERGEYMLLKFAQELEDIAKVEQMPKLEGKRMIMFLSPKSSKKNN